MHILNQAGLSGLAAVGQALRRWRDGLITEAVQPLRLPKM